MESNYLPAVKSILSWAKFSSKVANSFSTRSDFAKFDVSSAGVSFPMLTLHYSKRY